MENELNLLIYDRDLNFIGVIDNFISLRWKRRYFEAGEFELHLQASEVNINYLKKDYIIIREDREEAGFIKSIEIVEKEDNTELVIIGRFLSYLLYRRIIKSKINFTGTILNGMRTLLNNMTPFSKLEISSTQIVSDNITFQCTYKNVYKYINKLSLASNIGFRIKPDLENKKFKFQNFVGINRTAHQNSNPRYTFSEEDSNIEKADYMMDSSALCTWVLVGGEGEGDNRTLVTIDNTQNLHDFDIVEKFVDAKNETKGNLSTSEYKAILQEKGNEYISNITESINYEVYANDYLLKWDLGDIVTVKKESWGIEEDLRITEVEEVYEDSEKKITPTFGTPLPEIFNNEDD